jgi:hypothetical protein
MNVTLRVFLIGQQLFHFIVRQLLTLKMQQKINLEPRLFEIRLLFIVTQSGKQMPELGRTDVSAAVLVEMAQTFNEVLCRVCTPVLAHRLHDRQEHVKADSVI